MVANLSSHKKGWIKDGKSLATGRRRAQQYKDELLRLVDMDTKAFTGHVRIWLPKSTDERKSEPEQGHTGMPQDFAIEIPFKVMQASYGSMEII